MALNQVTIEMLEMLPSWMKMRSDPENSQGAKLLDAVGRELYDVEALINNILFSHHLELTPNSDGVDIASVDVLYKVQITSEVITDALDVVGVYNEVTYPLKQAKNIYDFYLPEEGVEKYYIDNTSLAIYLKVPFNGIIVNGAMFPDVTEHNVWGPYDEIGLLLGCPRIPGERNEAYTDSQGIERIGYRERLYDVFQNPGNSTRQGLINYLSRSFSIDQDDVTINELSDSFVQSLINADGTIKAELKEYLLLSNKINLSTSNVYWDVLEENRAGLSYLPIIWNVPLDKWNNDSLQNGIGDTGDIKVIGPEQDTDKQSFTYNVGVEGLMVAKRQVYPEHQLKYRVFATGQKYDEGYKPESYQYSVIASELIPLKFNVKAHKKYTHDIQQDLNCSTGAGTLLDYTSITTDKQVDKYIGKNIVVQPGSVVMNENARYIEILANLSTTDASKSPELDSVTLGYKTSGGTAKSIIVSGNLNPVQTNATTVTTGFEVNTWADTNPVLKIRSDTNDQYRAEYDSEASSLKLTRGEYQKTYNSEGDWDDGEKMNLRVTANGTIKLSI